MKKIVLLLLSIFSTMAYAQSPDCKCYKGIASEETDAPSLTLKFDNGTGIVVCGKEKARLEENKILMSAFNVFHCNNTQLLLEYDALQDCHVYIENGVLIIEELRQLPAGKDWAMQAVKIGVQRIYVENGELLVPDQEPAFEGTAIDQVQVDAFMDELQYMKRKKKHFKDPEIILAKLEILALNRVKKAMYILRDFERYFGYETKGAIREQWEDAVLMMEWVVL